jgi:hypothetical protein
VPQKNKINFNVLVLCPVPLLVWFITSGNFSLTP